MAEESDKDETSPDLIDARLDQLMRDSRVVEAVTLARRGRRADIGLMARSPKFFYDAKRSPLIPQFTPALVAKGGWSSAQPLLTVASSEKENAIANGKTAYFAAGIVNLADIADPRAFFRSFLEAGGDISIAPQFSPDLWRSVPYIGADSTTLDNEDLDFTGKGTAICIVDMGCDFAHRNFRRTDDPAKTRIRLLAVMDKDGKADEYTDTAVKPNRNLNSLIEKAKPYHEAGYDPNDPKYHVVPPDDGGSHGTLILDIAGGNGAGTGMAGVAPEADLYFIQIYISTNVFRRYVDGTQILLALAYARDKLAQLKVPAAVYNVSLGTNQGPHDTFDYHASADLSWNLAINALFEKKPGQCLVVSAGNNFNSALHASGKAAQNVPATFDVALQAGDTTDNPFTIWFNKGSPAVSVRAMLLDYKGAPKNYRTAWQGPGALIDGSDRDSGNLGDPMRFGTKGDLFSIAVTIKPPLLRDGVQLLDNDRWEIWRIEVSSSASSSSPTYLDAWMDRDDLQQAVFTTPDMPPGQSANADVDPIGSLNGLGAGVKNAIVVGAVGTATYTPGMPRVPVDGPGLGRAVAFSSAGPTRDKLLRPDVSAPGEGISGAKSGCDPVALKTGYEIAPTTIMSGTSMAAPHVTGLVALLFEKTARKLPDAGGVRKALVDTARPETLGSATRWDPQRGFGCVDAVKLLSDP